MWQARVYLIHVFEEKYIPEEFKKYAKDEKISPESYFDELCDQILEGPEDRAKNSGIKNVERICVHGNPADEILRAAETNKADLVIMGSRGLGTFSRAMLGSVSTKVCHYAPCTVITVK